MKTHSLCYLFFLLFPISAFAGTDHDHGCLWGISDGTEQAYIQMDSWQGYKGFKVQRPTLGEMFERAKTRAQAQGAHDPKEFIAAYLQCYQDAFKSIEQKRMDYQ